MLHAIVEAEAAPDHTVKVVWSDGVCGVVNMMPYIARGGLFAVLDDPSYFVREMRILPDGIGLTWPNEVDFSADGLREDAHLINASTSNLAKVG